MIFGDLGRLLISLDDFFFLGFREGIRAGFLWVK